MDSQHCTFPGFVPNMVSRLARPSGENTGDTQTPFPRLELTDHSSFSGMRSLQHYPSDSTHSFPTLNLEVPSRRLELSPSPDMSRNTSGLSPCMTGANSITCGNEILDSSQHGLSQQVQSFASAGNTTQVAPISSKASGVKVSRLPSNNVPRKAPLRGNSRSSKSPSRDISRKIPKPRQERSVSQQETSTKNAVPAQKRRRGAIEKRRSTSKQVFGAQLEADRGEKETRRNADQESEDIQIIEETFRKISDDDKEKENDTAETTTRDNVHNEEEINFARASRRETRTSRSFQVPLPSHAHRSCARRPVYDYEVPLELEGIRRALGKKQSPPRYYLAETSS
jgi:hypothetical protein